MEGAQVKTKVLVFESSDRQLEIVHQLCDQNDLIPLKSGGDNMLNVLKSNTDLGAILLGEDYLDSTDKLLVLMKEIHQMRPELPVIIRTEAVEKMAQLIADEHFAVGCFSGSDQQSFKEILDKHLFSSHYPISLIRGFQEISQEAIEANVRHCDIEVSAPYLVKDRIIYGELMSMIPLESDWYRGYMMLQTTEAEMQALIEHGLTPLNPKDTGFRFVNSLLNEIANLIWGRIKNQFGSNGEPAPVVNTQVPIAINHLHRYISFGTDEPQLCFHYQIKNTMGEPITVDLYQKFVFNLSWYPENFTGAKQETEQLVEAGELEFF